MRRTTLMKGLAILVLGAAGLARAADGGVTLPPYETVTLANGTELLLMEKHDVPLVALSATLRGGPLGDVPGREGTAALLAELLRKGAGPRDAAQFAEAVESVGGQLATAVGRESLELSAEFLARDLDLMLELVGDALLRPRLEAAEFDKLRQRAIDEIAAAKDSDPSPLLPLYGNAWLFGDHPYARPSGGDEASLAAIRHADVVGQYRSHLGADRLIIAVVGDFKTRALRKSLERRFGSWRRAEAPLPAVPAAPRQTGRRVLLVDKPGATQTHFWIGNVGASRSDPARVAQGLANSAFGGRFTSMLNSELRIRTGLTYGAASGIARYRAPGAIALRSFTATPTTAQAIDLALETLGRLHAQGLDATALQATQRYVLGSFPPELETGPQLAGKLAELAFHGLGRDDVDQYAARVQATTLDEVRRAIAQLYPRPEDLAMVFIGDAAQVRGVLSKYGPLNEMPMSTPRFVPPPAGAAR